MNLHDIANSLTQELPGDNPKLTGVSIDSRKVQADHLFVAIQGARFDGHDFIKEAVKNGAAAVVCSQELHLKVPHIKVQDTLHALTLIATQYRKTLTCPVIALTGSNGKTTVKEMIAAILPKPSFATPGNLNNHIGVPLSVLQMKPEHRYAVLELGANHPGEIAQTVAVAAPKVALINNIAPAHVEGFGSIEGVACAKGEIYQGLAEDGIAVVNQDDEYHDFWNHLFNHKKVLRFSQNTPQSIHALDVSLDDKGCPAFTLVTPQGQIPVKLQVAGVHNVHNALAAAACTYALDISLADIARGLAEFSGVSGRMTFLQAKDRALVIDDTYNANLRSTLSALSVLARRDGRRILVFGDMGELGDYTKAHHQAVGHEARQLGIDAVLTVGVHSKWSSEAFGHGGRHYQQQTKLVQDLLPYLDHNTTILIKGSRGAAMENIVQQLIG